VRRFPRFLIVTSGRSVSPGGSFKINPKCDLAHPKGFEPLASAFGDLGSKPFILILQSFFRLKQIDFDPKKQGLRGHAVAHPNALSALL
jgi:hypothetical protein